MKENKKTASNVQYKEYLIKLYTASITIKADTQHTLGEKLMAISLKAGRSLVQAKDDVRRILNLRSAVASLLDKYVEKTLLDSAQEGGSV